MCRVAGVLRGHGAQAWGLGAVGAQSVAARGDHGSVADSDVNGLAVAGEAQVCAASDGEVVEVWGQGVEFIVGDEVFGVVDRDESHGDSPFGGAAVSLSSPLGSQWSFLCLSVGGEARYFLARIQRRVCTHGAWSLVAPLLGGATRGRPARRRGDGVVGVLMCRWGRVPSACWVMDAADCGGERRGSE